MKTDKKILQLQKVIAEKEKEVAALKKSPKWNTNASIVVNGNRYNLNTIDHSTCIEILSHLIEKRDSKHNACVILGLSGFDKFCGFTYAEWEHDLILRCEILKIREKENKIKQMKQILEDRLSDEAKAEKDIQSIEEELKDL